MTHPREELGAYALGTLDPADEAAVSAHLDGCDACAAELDELAGTAALLGTLELADVAPEPAPEHLYARTLAAAEPRRPQRRARWLVAAAAVVVIAGAGVGIGVHGSPDRPPAFTATAGAVRMTVRPTAELTGTTIAVQVSGLPENERCHLVAVARDGSTHVAGDWVATYHGDATVTGSTEVPRDELRTLVLYGTAGQRLVSVGV